ncbi:type II toxin-antitoxin system VapC family toxin [Sphingomonas sp. LT1P40]|uniref:type II toxin-antitoxin system VapC family toxin n=1 Tax=Alteristakelama amylovorans TaxID=3096166 RepID=UPI002FC72DE8
MTRYFIDANCVIHALSGAYPKLVARLADCAPGEVALSTITFAEVILGTAHGKPPPPELIEAFVEAVPLAPFDEAAARAYAKLPFKRARFDRLLAAHALSIDATIVTNDEADFADIPDLKIENWSQ